ncbi:MAG: inositol monophosphatase family protein [Solirubrobacteraceae bacterium]
MLAVPEADDDLTLALELADLADEITMARFGAEDLLVETKPDLTPVSEADRAVEQTLRARLAELAPGDAIVGEEYGVDAVPGAHRRWVLDPIDGTKSYVRGVPVWATLLALEEDGVLSTGVVSAPALSRRWWATRGAGAFVREAGAPPRPLRVSAIRSLSDAQLCFGGFEEWLETGRLQALTDLGRRCWRTRGYGDFWQYMLVAEGAAEIAIDPAASFWDLAAPLVVVAEAGGRFTDLGGVVTAEGGDGLATNGPLHETVLDAVGRPSS